MRLQRNQLRLHMEGSGQVLTECKENFMMNPGEFTLKLYLAVLSDLGNYEEMLSFQENDSGAKEILQGTG